MWMEAYTTNSDPKVIADYYISTVTRIGGCPQRMRADRGTKNGHVREMQLFLRRNQTDHHAGEGSFIYGCSTANQRIESWWGVLRKQSVQFWMDTFKILKDDGYFTGDFLDKNLVQFCFLNLLQLYGAAEDRLQCILPEEVAVCKEECTPKGQYPCDETVFELYFIQDFWETSSSDPLPTFIAVKHVKKLISINRRKICQSIPEEILLLAAHKLKEACLQVTVRCPKQHFL
ncbi:hypothetical protein NQZ68_039741 [Dissostichus eleginoides]|nr:hypothetical protein NQZ68_039741 [Dissostichus eleginoides]